MRDRRLVEFEGPLEEGIRNRSEIDQVVESTSLRDSIDPLTPMNNNHGANLDTLCAKICGWILAGLFVSGGLWAAFFSTFPG